MGVNKPVLEEDETGVDASRLIETVLYIPRSLVDAHHTNIRAGSRRCFHYCNGIVCIGIGPAGTGVHVHQTHLQPSERPSQFGSAVDRHLLSGYRIDSDLTAEEQLILVADVEVEDPCVFEEELTFLRNEHLERCEIQRLKIAFRIAKISVSRQIQDQI